ncbi:hypothetical protein GCM10022225_45430 [Plantactinospora mayteni]|uniref:Uncharacterized protein n=1 Tax=Plantactinospora mayteni TaxID=566021 RepID=A0ABQ4EXP1_9ACTN|nr:hypothetical protein Pma05_59520 [Plantactinospora mayteni]
MQWASAAGYPVAEAPVGTSTRQFGFAGAGAGWKLQPSITVSGDTPGRSAGPIRGDQGVSFTPTLGDYSK